MQPGRPSYGCPEDGAVRHDHADECVSRRHAINTEVCCHAASSGPAAPKAC